MQIARNAVLLICNQKVPSSTLGVGTNHGRSNNSNHIRFRRDLEQSLRIFDTQIINAGRLGNYFLLRLLL